jgi:hypothetical protein
MVFYYLILVFSLVLPFPSRVSTTSLISLIIASRAPGWSLTPTKTRRTQFPAETLSPIFPPLLSFLPPPSSRPGPVLARRSAAAAQCHSLLVPQAEKAPCASLLAVLRFLLIHHQSTFGLAPDFLTLSRPFSSMSVSALSFLWEGPLKVSPFLSRTPLVCRFSRLPPNSAQKHQKNQKHLSIADQDQHTKKHAPPPGSGIHFFLVPSAIISVSEC